MAMTERHFMDPRRAGEVQRYHTYPVLRHQSVAEHTWQVIRVLLAIWPDSPRHVIIYAVTHDCGEVRTGDLPYPHKSERSEAWVREQNDSEKRAVLSMCAPWGLPAPPPMEANELCAFKLAEYIEMWEFGLCEMNRGNRYAQLITTRCVDAMRLILARDQELPPGVGTSANNYIRRRSKQEKDITDD